MIKKYYVNTDAKSKSAAITNDVRFAIHDAGVKEGIVSILLPKWGASLFIMEFIPEIALEISSHIARLIPENEKKQTVTDRLKRPVDVNAYCQSIICGRSITIPIVDGKLVTDPYDDVVVVAFQDEAVRREIIISVLGAAPPAAEQSPKGQPKR